MAQDFEAVCELLRRKILRLYPFDEHTVDTNFS